MSNATAWAMLVAAGLVDVGWAVTLNYAEGYTRLWWSVASLVLLAAFVVLLGRALAVLLVGVAYTAWPGIGAIGTAAVGAALFGAGLGWIKLPGVALKLPGVVVLKFAPE